MNKKILITGGAGFIGSALARFWISNGAEVHIVDNRQLSTTNAYDIEQQVTFYSGDVSTPDVFEKIGEGFDIAYHLAAQTSARVSEEVPYLDIDTNVKGAYNFCKWARDSKPSRVVFTSSMAVYGSHGDSIVETAIPTPCSVYGITKLAGEHLFRNLKNEGVNVSIFRLFNVYGPGQDYSNLKQGMASVYIAHALTKAQIEVTGSFDRYRDFVYIDDVVDALVRPIPVGRQWILNVGNGRPVTVSQLLQIILKHGRELNPELVAVEMESHRGDVFGNYSDNTALLRTGWISRTSLENGISLAFKDAIKVLRPECHS